MNQRRYCRVCWQTLGQPSANGFIRDHFDSVGRDVCPMSGELFELAGIGRRGTVQREYIAPLVVDHDPHATAADAVGTARLDRFELILGESA